MRIVRFIDADHTVHLGREVDHDSAELLDGSLFTGLTPTGKIVAIEKRLAPIAPANIYCIGLNYAEHAKESESTPGEHPVVFMKPNGSVIADGDAIRLPACSKHGPEVDYECELAVVIGKAAKTVKPADALDYVFGYTAANDVSARRWQRHAGGGQWIRGKGFDTFCPLGPAIVTADEIPNPQALQISTTLNGRVMQNSSTADMIFPVAEIIAYLSEDTTLHPGTVILTGTPQGVGVARKPPVFLQPGDSVAVTVEKIGTITNSVEAASA